MSSRPRDPFERSGLRKQKKPSNGSTIRGRQVCSTDPNGRNPFLIRQDDCVFDAVHGNFRWSIECILSYTALNNGLIRAGTAVWLRFDQIKANSYFNFCVGSSSLPRASAFLINIRCMCSGACAQWRIGVSGKSQSSKLQRTTPRAYRRQISNSR